MQYVDIMMSDYQQELYSFYEDIENAIAKKKRHLGKGGSETYKSYTRQSCNFVFPSINQRITGETRPRPSKFRLTDKDSHYINEGKGQLKVEKGTEKFTNVSKYVEAMQEFTTALTTYFGEIRSDDKKNGHTIDNDFETFKKKYDGDFNKFLTNKKKSKLFEKMHMCSAKMLCMCFNILNSPGSVLVYSNYVQMEGLSIFKIYLAQFDFDSFKNRPRPYRGYAEFHGGIKDMNERAQALHEFNKKDNILGQKIKIMMISPAGAEGLSLSNVRQVHLMEPYWHEVRITQMIGRAVRQCSHRDLPMSDRHVDVFRYKSVRPGEKWTTDQQIEDLARSKDSLIQSFLNAIKEVAVDCVINKAHNSLEQEYRCFQFDEPSLFDKHIGPAYKEDIYDDMKVDNGSNSMKSMTVKIKAIKIQAVIKLNNEDDPDKYSDPKDYWFYPESGVVYDFDLKYPIGKILSDGDNIPSKLNKSTYIIDQLIPIPQIE